MKTALRCFILSVVLVIGSQQAKSQCSASDILIQNIVATGAQTPGTCNAEFDLSFTLEANNGNKFIFFHAWRPDLYPDYFQCVNGEPSGNGNIAAPEASDLAAAFINLGIDNSGASPVLLTSYPADASVILNTADSVTVTTLPDGSYSFVIHGLLATLPGDCNGPIIITADFWSTQSANGQNAQCVNCNISYALNFVQASGIALCLNLTYFATLTNRTTSALDGDYLVYADVNNDGVLSTSVDSLIRDTTAFSIAAGVGSTTAINGTIPGINLNQNLLLQVLLDSPAEGTSMFTIISTQCVVLPVTFQSFTAVRSSADVVRLKWETASENNNSGFAVERNIGRDNWQTVTFIPTQAPGGISNNVLTYAYDDMNSFKGTTQYRIRQVDLNGTARYSEIRQVKGDLKNNEMVIYPNPANGGTVNVQFNDEQIRNIQLFDMNGRVIRRWNAVAQNSIRIDNLLTGVYTLKAVVKESGLVLTEKLVVY